MTPIIVVNSYSVRREALLRRADVFKNRPTGYIEQNITMNENKGMIHLNAEESKEQKTFMHQVFREFGVGKLKMEAKIQKELAKFCQHVELLSSDPFNPWELLQQSVSNITLLVLFNTRFDYGNDKLLSLLHHIIDGFVKKSVATAPVRIFPLLRILPGAKSQLDAMKLSMDEIMKFAHEQVEKAKYDESTIAYVYHQKVRDDKRHGGRTSFTDEQMLHLFRELLVVGSVSSVNRLYWLILLLAYHEEVQEKMYNELLHHFPSVSDISSKKRDKCVYTQAVFLESLRWTVVDTFLMPLVAERETTLCGYRIPQDSLLLICESTINKNAKYFEDPMEFRPERFIDEKTGLIDKPEYFRPFSMGRHSCLGETLAVMQIFLYMSTLIYEYHVALDVNTSQSGADLLTPLPGMSRLPGPYCVKLTRRNKSSID